MKLKGKANWDSTPIKFIAANAQESIVVHSWKWSDSRSSADGNLAFFQCPGCPHVEYSSCKAFQTHDLDKKQKCNACVARSGVNRWKCECNDYWHKCLTHRRTTCKINNPNMMRETNRQTLEKTSGDSKAKRTRTIGPLSYEQMLAEDVRAAKRSRNDDDDEWITEPTITLGVPKIKSIKVSSLGPILKKRFICG